VTIETETENEVQAENDRKPDQQKGLDQDQTSGKPKKSSTSSVGSVSSSARTSIASTGGELSEDGAVEETMDTKSSSLKAKEKEKGEPSKKKKVSSSSKHDPDKKIIPNFCDISLDNIIDDFSGPKKRKNSARLSASSLTDEMNTSGSYSSDVGVESYLPSKRKKR